MGESKIYCSKILDNLICVSFATKKSLLDKRDIDDENLNIKVIHNTYSNFVFADKKENINLKENEISICAI